MIASSRQSPALFVFLFLFAFILTFLAQDAADGDGDELVRRISSFFGNHQKQWYDGGDPTIASFGSDDEEAELDYLRKRLAPKKLLFVEESSNTLVPVPHQFLHLHHMKTGGTSMDGLIKCGMSRLKEVRLSLNYTNLHECSESHYEKCLSGQSKGCLTSVHDAAIMSYCAPLRDLGNPFLWNKESIHAAVTVFRHPVARVWSMYRFQTRSCYQCRNLTDIYTDIDAAGSDDGLKRMCRLQLQNHQTRNLLSNVENETPESSVHVQEAISNMKTVFSMIGLTEDMPTTALMAGIVFPWLAEELNLEDSIDSHIFSNAQSSSTKCTMPHANSSPKNNHCGAGGKSHWNLPAEPDAETARVIMEHNKADMELYEAAVRQFSLQKLALNL